MTRKLLALVAPAGLLGVSLVLAEPASGAVADGGDQSPRRITAAETRRGASEPDWPVYSGPGSPAPAVPRRIGSQPDASGAWEPNWPVYWGPGSPPR